MRSIVQSSGDAQRAAERDPQPGRVDAGGERLLEHGCRAGQVAARDERRRQHHARLGRARERLHRVARHLAHALRIAAATDRLEQVRPGRLVVPAAPSGLPIGLFRVVRAAHRGVRVAEVHQDLDGLWRPGERGAIERLGIPWPPLVPQRVGKMDGRVEVVGLEHERAAKGHLGLVELPGDGARRTEKRVRRRELRPQLQDALRRGERGRAVPGGDLDLGDERVRVHRIRLQLERLRRGRTRCGVLSCPRLGQCKVEPDRRSARGEAGGAGESIRCGRKIVALAREHADRPQRFGMVGLEREHRPERSLRVASAPRAL